MRIAVFGYNGQVASAFRSVVKDYPNVILECLGRDQVDITSRQQVLSRMLDMQPDLIVNTAAYTAVDDAEDHQQDAYSINVDGAAYVAEASKILDIPVIHFSTDYVFDGQNKQPYEPWDPVAPQSVYGHSKHAGEEKVQEINSRHIIIRTAWVFSAIGRNFVKTMLQLMGNRQTLNVVNDQIGCPTSADQLARAVLTIAPIVCDQHFQEFGIYHVSSDYPVSWYEFAKEIQELAILEYGQKWVGRSCQITPIPSSEYLTKAQRPKYSVLSNAKFNKVFNYKTECRQQNLRNCITLLGMDK